MLRLKTTLLLLAFLLLASAILATGLYLYWQSVQSDDVITIRSAREGVTLTVATETPPGGWGR